MAVDPESAAYYRSLPGRLGDDLRRVLVEEDGDTVLRIEDRRCPMWRTDGLCRIQAELGHDALCETCRRFPRIVHDYGDFQQWQLELSCPEAARLILADSLEEAQISEIPGGSEPDYDGQDMALLLESKAYCLSLLKDERFAANEILALMLLYGYHVQQALDGDEMPPFDPAQALQSAHSFARGGGAGAVLDFFRHLEILTPEWSARLCAPRDNLWQRQILSLARYFVERYWLQAVSDFDLVSRVKFILISCLTVKLLGGDLTETAQKYSKEIENDPDNVESILDGAYTAPAFTDEKLLDLLLQP